MSCPRMRRSQHIHSVTWKEGTEEWLRGKSGARRPVLIFTSQATWVPTALAPFLPQGLWSVSWLVACIFYDTLMWFMYQAVGRDL